MQLHKHMIPHRYDSKPHSELKKTLKTYWLLSMDPFVLKARQLIPVSIGEFSGILLFPCTLIPFSSSSRSSEGKSSLLDGVGSGSQVPQAIVQLAGYGSVVWPDSLSEWLRDGAGLQQMFCCLTASTTRALLCVADVEFGIQVIVTG